MSSSRARDTDIAWRIHASSSNEYEVRVAEPLFDPSNDALLSGGSKQERRFVILDDGVPGVFRSRLSSYFETRGIEARLMVVGGGEKCKSMETVLAIMAAIEDFRLDRRNEPVIVVGGGAVLDAGGFAASVYRRGVPFVRVPTTLLAYVDASVGIKTGVNFGSGKNLIGTFTPPKAVLLDRCFLRSLPASEISSGLGEVLKLGVGCDAALFASLEGAASRFFSGGFEEDATFEILQRSIEVMLRELAPNIYEQDLCRAVDLGHTFSQVFEMRPGEHALRHGEAVALDVNLSALLSKRRAWLSRNDVDRVVSLTERLGLRIPIPEVEPATLWDAVQERRRHRGGRQRIPLPLELGECAFVDDLTPEEIRAALEELWSEE